jgi:hypothetical protein
MAERHAHSVRCQFLQVNDGKVHAVQSTLGRSRYLERQYAAASNNKGIKVKQGTIYKG